MLFRSEAVEALARDQAVNFVAMQDFLRGLSDIERIASRIAMASVRPRELAGLRTTLAMLPRICEALAKCENETLNRLSVAINIAPEWLSLLQTAVMDEPALVVRDGGVIAGGYSADLDELRAIQNDSSTFLTAMEATERERTDRKSTRLNSSHERLSRMPSSA